MKAHIRPNRPTALAWGFDANSSELCQLNTVCANVGLTLVPVGPNDLTRCVGELCGLPGHFSAAAVNCRTDFPPALILSGLAEKALDQLLAALRQQQLNIPLKAVVTTINRQWPLCELLNELCEEHAAFQQQQQR